MAAAMLLQGRPVDQRELVAYLNRRGYLLSVAYNDVFDLEDLLIENLSKEGDGSYTFTVYFDSDFNRVIVGIKLADDIDVSGSNYSVGLLLASTDKILSRSEFRLAWEDLDITPLSDDVSLYLFTNSSN